MYAISQRGIDLIKQFEGLRLEAYEDSVGVLTIGYGHTLNVKAGDTCDEADAEYLLRQDLADAEGAVHSLVRVPLNQNQLDALLSFVFNLGRGNLAKSTLLKKLNASDYAGASLEFTKWNRAGGQVLKGLTRRREAEQALFNEPISP